MKIIILSFFMLLGLSVIGVAQQADTSKVVTKQKKIVIKTIDREGNVETKVFQDEKGANEADKIKWFSKDNDTILIEVFVDGMEGEDIGLDSFEAFEVDDFETYDGFLDEGRRKMIILDRMDAYSIENRVPKAKLGVMIAEGKEGVKVTGVEDFSAAYSVGILSGDVFTHVGGVKITNVEELQREIGSKKPGDMTEIKFRRNGKKKSVDVRLDGQDQLKFRSEMPFGREFKDFRWQEKGSGRKGGNTESKCCDKHSDKKCCSGSDRKYSGHQSGKNCCDSGSDRKCSGHQSDKKCCDSGSDKKCSGHQSDKKCCDKHSDHKSCTKHGEGKGCEKNSGHKDCKNHEGKSKSK